MSLPDSSIVRMCADAHRDGMDAAYRILIENFETWPKCDLSTDEVVRVIRIARKAIHPRPDASLEVKTPTIEANQPS